MRILKPSASKMAATSEKELLKFMPFSSCINPSFWAELTRLKLEEYKLDDDFKDLVGYFNSRECSKLIN